MVTKAQVIEALAGLYVNRSKKDGYAYVRAILQRHGGGAININELAVAHYAAVYAAAGGVKHHPLADAVEREPWDVPDAPGIRDVPLVSTPARIQSPLTIELESRLATARAKTKRSVPNYVVNIGNASRPEDMADDVVQNEPSGLKMA